MNLASLRAGEPIATREVVAPRFSKTDLGILAFVLLLCGAFAYMRWLKLETLVWGDPPRWLFEAQRVAAGETLYKDFSWQYAPFSLLAFGWVMRWFGVTFPVAQICEDIASIVVVLAAYFFVRRLLPRFFHAPVLFGLIAVCGTSLMFFNLFSFATYVPSLQTAAAGFLLFSIGVLNYMRTGEMSAATWMLFTVGAFVGAYSKPESFVATYSTLAVLAVVDRVYWFAGRKTGGWLWHYAKVGLACAGPAAIAYAWTAGVAGFDNMRAGITGYGLAGAACPWWPTGLGMFGAAASLGEAASIAFLLSLTRRKQFAARFGPAYYSMGLAAAFAGACVFVAYVANTNWALLTGNRSLADKFWYSAPSTLWTSAVLLPVMWSCVALWLYLALRFLLSRERKLDGDLLTLLVLLTGPVAMSARGWFNWSLDIRTDVPGICFPIFLILGPYLLWRFLALAGPGPDLSAAFRSKAALAIVFLLVAYGAARIVAAYPGQLSNARYQALSTTAGPVWLAQYSSDAEIYKFVVENTSPGDPVLDVPYGGGINFAAHRSSPFFDTQFRHVSMADKYLRQDLEGIQRRPPKVIIAENEPNYGAVYGLQGCTCPFPRLVWAPGTSSVVPDKIFPAFDEIQQKYRVAKRVGHKLLLVPK